MTGEQRRSRTERVRKDAGRVAIAAAIAAAACAPAATANNGNGNGNANGNGNPPAHANPGGGSPPAHANNDNGNRSSGQNGGSRGNSGNAPGRSHGNPTPGTRPSQAPPSWSNAGGNRPSTTPKPGKTPSRGSDSREHSNNGAAHQKTTICHATGSSTNPYVRITISDRALKAHARHHDGHDIIPAPDGECPTAATTAKAAEAIAGLAPAFDAALPGSPEVAGATASGDAQPGGPTEGRRVSAGDVAGVEATNETPASGTAGDPAAAANASGGEEDDGGSLPFTGLAVLMLAIAGALLLATGVGLRRSRVTHT